MGICWYCTWGWSKAGADIYDKYLPIAGEDAMHFGPAHIVWEDENFDRSSVQWCLDNFDSHSHDDHDLTRDSVEQLEAVKASLVDLLALDDAHLSPEPADYDGKNPDNYHPQVEMARR